MGLMLLMVGTRHCAAATGHTKPPELGTLRELQTPSADPGFNPGTHRFDGPKKLNAMWLFRSASHVIVDVERALTPSEKSLEKDEGRCQKRARV